eukprot:m.252468 g.252468  ORF g.252468 m.252468 type:complete len:247 (+) comp15473_c2_seq12:616-1356(+)
MLLCTMHVEGCSDAFEQASVNFSLLDTLLLARQCRKHKSMSLYDSSRSGAKQSNTLSALYKHYVGGAFQAHDALSDCVALAEVLCAADEMRNAMFDGRIVDASKFMGTLAEAQAAFTKRMQQEEDKPTKELSDTQRNQTGVPPVQLEGGIEAKTAQADGKDETTREVEEAGKETTQGQQARHRSICVTNGENAKGTSRLQRIWANTLASLPADPASWQWNEFLGLLKTISLIAVLVFVAAKPPRKS